LIILPFNFVGGVGDFKGERDFDPRPRAAPSGGLISQSVSLRSALRVLRGLHEDDLVDDDAGAFASGLGDEFHFAGEDESGEFTDAFAAFDEAAGGRMKFEG